MAAIVAWAVMIGHMMNPTVFSAWGGRPANQKPPESPASIDHGDQRETPRRSLPAQLFIVLDKFLQRRHAEVGILFDSRLYWLPHQSLFELFTRHAQDHTCKHGDESPVRHRAQRAHSFVVATNP